MQQEPRVARSSNAPVMSRMNRGGYATGAVVSRAAMSSRAKAA